MACEIFARKGISYMYDSTSIVQIFQDEPLDWKPSHFKLKGWTETIVGYIHNAAELSKCLVENRRMMKRNYKWAVSINVERELSPKDISGVWSKVCRKLRTKGVVALWVREPSRDNHCNYHLLVKSDMTRAALVTAIEESMPDRSELPWHKYVERVKYQWYWPRYIFKAKTTGRIDGRYDGDKYGNKRLLFKPHLRLRKYDTIGNFWEKPRKQIWQDVKDKEKRIADGLEKPNIRKLVDHVYEWLHQYVPKQKLERKLGWGADSPAIHDWAHTLFGGDDDEQVLVEEQLIADTSDYQPGQHEDEEQQDKSVLDRSLRSPLLTLVTPVGAFVVRLCRRLMGWRCTVRNTRPDPLSLHPP